MSEKLPKKTLGHEDILDNINIIEEYEYKLKSDVKDLVQYEFNLIELPFFTKDRNIQENVSRRYIFSETASMLVVPSAIPGDISHKILQEFDEKIFFGILRLAEQQKSKKIITDYFTLAEVAGVNYYRFLDRMKDSIQRLSGVMFVFSDIFYNAKIRRQAKGSDRFILLQRAKTYEYNDVIDLNSDIDLDDEEREICKKYFQNRRISSVLILTLADHIYSNIENKGYLAISHKGLLSIDNSTTRKLFVLISKWHGYDLKHNKNIDFLLRDCKFIASRIPLSWKTSTNIADSIKIIENAAKTLKDQNLIKNYVLTRTKPLNDSKIKFIFYPEKDDIISKFNAAAAQLTGHEKAEILLTEDTEENMQMQLFDVFGLLPEIKDLFDSIPADLKTDSVKKLFEKFADKGFDFIKSNLDYSLENYSDNFPAYLNKALSEDFAADLRQKAELKAKKEQEKKEREAAAAAAEKARREDLERRATEIYRNMTPEEKEKFKSDLKRRPFFEIAFKSFNNDLEKFAIFNIASNLEKN